MDAYGLTGEVLWGCIFITHWSVRMCRVDTCCSSQGYVEGSYIVGLRAARGRPLQEVLTVAFVQRVAREGRRPRMRFHTMASPITVRGCCPTISDAIFSLGWRYIGLVVCLIVPGFCSPPTARVEVRR